MHALSTIGAPLGFAQRGRADVALVGIALAGALLWSAAPGSARAEPTSAVAHTHAGLDCTFFKSQAFNRAPDHYTVQMHRLCGMLSAYKRAVIEANSAEYRADYIARRGGADLVPSTRQRPIGATSDAGNYLIARDIGLIDAIADLPATGP
ncbi:MAG: hypothetical protein AAF677_16420 [Pseudomonadota bacterium]